ncbi:hypothetical protein ACIRPT_14470 [Streptomyces sp. NPDC101227]|uniref:hypothetical protein n=1 Tax=Streptomyces sp. NPDC101227 TaxID=3366136 RepID=UPI00381FD7AC
MKYAKSAAIVAGSVMAIVAAAPAFAAGPTAPRPVTPRMGLNGGLADVLHNEPLDGRQVAPLVKTVKATAKTVKAKNFLRGNKVNGAQQSLLGGLPLPK